jgi:hypothetical protein
MTAAATSTRNTTHATTTTTTTAAAAAGNNNHNIWMTATITTTTTGIRIGSTCVRHDNTDRQAYIATPQQTRAANSGNNTMQWQRQQHLRRN